MVEGEAVGATIFLESVQLLEFVGSLIYYLHLQVFFLQGGRVMEKKASGLRNEMLEPKTSIFHKTEKRKCFIGLFDILGFKDRVYRDTHEEISKLMTKTRNHIKTIESMGNSPKGLRNEMKPPIEGIEPAFFSDTIMFVSESDSESCFWKLMVLTANFLIHMLLEEIPLKGALSFGEMTTNFKESIYFGRPLVDAHLLSEENYFCGAVIHHSLQEYCKKNNLPLEKYFLKSGKIPMKGGAITHLYIDLISFSEAIELNDFKKDNIQKLYLNVSGHPRRYIDNTLSVYFPD